MPYTQKTLEYVDDRPIFNPNFGEEWFLLKTHLDINVCRGETSVFVLIETYDDGEQCVCYTINGAYRPMSFELNPFIHHTIQRGEDF